MKKAIMGCLILSILHSILFYRQSLGISVLLFAIPSVFLLIRMLKKYDKVKNSKALYLAIPIILLSSTYLFFDNAFFNVINMFIIPVLFGIMIVWATTDTFKLKILFGKSINLIIGSLEFIPNGIKLIKEAFKFNRKDTKEKTNNKKIKQIGIGILCTIPLLLIILALLISADEIFASLFGNISNEIMKLFTSESLILLVFRILLIIIVTIYLACIIYNIFNKESAFNKVKTSDFKCKLKIDKTIINTILTIINVVYLVFSIVQVIYIINPQNMLPNFKLSQYARQGFFQLMIVSLINFVIILITNSNKAEESSQYTKIMNVLMSIFTIIIAVSSFIRMNLYEQEFGYTFLRLMVYVILVTEIIMIIPTIYYIIKGRINLFKYYFIIALSMYVVVNFVNVDATIARKNVNRYINKTTKREIDFTYLKNNTGNDAIPEIVKLYNNVDDEKLKTKINNYLYSSYNNLKEKRTWQEFNISKTKADNLLKEMNLQYIKTTTKTKERNNTPYVEIGPTGNV